MNNTKGYKVFNPDWTCRNYQYEVGCTYEEDVSPKCCEIGFHFCIELKDCFNYYDFNPDNKVAEIIALGDIDKKLDNSKCCTNKIKIVRELTWEEVLRMVNQGKENTGFSNTGNRNTGNCNTGNWNTGDWNTGDWNTGDWNTGDCNTGDCNTGDRNTGNCNTGNRNTGNWNTGNRNTGNWNTGNCNTGNCNTGNWNTGNWNTGNRNTGDWNTGDCNTGDCNTGDCNTGNCNTGDCNTGNCNTGNRNTGNWNTGDWNKSDFNTGCFNTDEQKILIFNKQSDLTYRKWIESNARYILNQIPKNVIEWIYSSDMTDEEKNSHPEHKTTGGYLKILDESECAQIWWNGLSEDDRKIIKSIPNFDKEIFEDIVGINI